MEERQESDSATASSLIPEAFEFFLSRLCVAEWSSATLETCQHHRQRNENVDYLKIFLFFALHLSLALLSLDLSLFFAVILLKTSCFYGIFVNNKAWITYVLCYNYHRITLKAYLSSHLSTLGMIFGTLFLFISLPPPIEKLSSIYSSTHCCVYFSLQLFSSTPFFVSSSLSPSLLPPQPSSCLCTSQNTKVSDV